jgi:hypothetical protein
LDVEVGPAAGFAVSRIRVEIEISEEGSPLIIAVPSAEDLDVFVPDDILALTGGRNSVSILAGELHKAEAEYRLECLEHAGNG